MHAASYRRDANQDVDAGADRNAELVEHGMRQL